MQSGVSLTLKPTSYSSESTANIKNCRVVGLGLNAVIWKELEQGCLLPNST